MTADPWPLAVLLRTISAQDKKQEPGWANPPKLVWSPDQEEHLRAAWQGDAIRATDVPDLHAGPVTGPTACVLSSRRCALSGWWKGVPRWGAFRRCERRLNAGAPPPLAASPLGGPPGSATHVLWARVCGLWGPSTAPLACMPCWGLLAAEVVRGRPRGGWPSTVARGVWCHALSLPRPPVLWGGRSGFRDPCIPSAAGVGVGTQHQPYSVCPCEPLVRAVEVAERRPRGGLPFAVVRGV